MIYHELPDLARVCSGKRTKGEECGCGMPMSLTSEGHEKGIITKSCISIMIMQFAYKDFNICKQYTSEYNEIVSTYAAYVVVVD
jgi:hypothetical protein